MLRVNLCFVSITILFFLSHTCYSLTQGASEIWALNYNGNIKQTNNENNRSYVKKEIRNLAREIGTLKKV